MFTDISSNLNSGPVSLSFEKVVTPNSDGQEVPFYHFKVIIKEGIIVGHINFRVGDTQHVYLTAGHIGYNIYEEHRGNAYSYYACCALVPFIRQHYSRVILTADPKNHQSIRTIEKLGACFLNEIEVPLTDPAYKSGARNKKRYEWTP